MVETGDARMSIEDRKAGYKAGLINSGELLWARWVGSIAKGNIILRKGTELKDGHYLFALTREELDKLTSGEIPMEG